MRTNGIQESFYSMFSFPVNHLLINSCGGLLPSCKPASQNYSWQRILPSPVKFVKLHRHWLIWIWYWKGALGNERGLDKEKCLPWMGVWGEENTPKQGGNPNNDSAREPQIFFSLPAVDLANRDNKDHASPARHRTDYSTTRNCTSWGLCGER